MSAESEALAEVAAQQGWDSDSVETVLLDYIEAQGSPDAFSDYLRDRAAQENSHDSNEWPYA